MALTGLSSTKGDDMGVWAAKNRLLVESTIKCGDPEDPSEAQVQGGRLLTDPFLPQVTHTNYISAGANTVGTLSARADRCSLLVVNTGSTPVFVKIEANDPTSSDIPLAPGEKFTAPFPTVSQVRFVGPAASWSILAVEGARS